MTVGPWPIGIPEVPWARREQVCSLLILETRRPLEFLRTQKARRPLGVLSGLETLS